MREVGNTTDDDGSINSRNVGVCSRTRGRVANLRLEVRHCEKLMLKMKVKGN